MEIIIISSLICITCIVLTFTLSKSQGNTVNLVNSKVSELKNEYDKVIPLGFENNNQNLNYVGFKNDNKELSIKTKYQTNIIKYDEIVSAELITNGKTVMSVGDIIGGGILFGGAGAIIASMNKKEKILSKKLKFNLNNFNNPSYEIDMLNNGKTAEFGINTDTSVGSIIDTVNYIINQRA